MNLTVIQGGRGAQRRFVCGWCGASFDFRFAQFTIPGEGSLEQHWQASPRCRANRGVNNPRQDKYHDGT